MKHLSKISLLLTLTLLAATACGGDPADTHSSDDNADTAPSVETEAVETEAQLEVPDGLTSDYDVFSILAVGGTVSSPEEFDEGFDVLGKAKYERTAAVEDAFDIDIQFVDVSGWKNFQGQARQSISSGSDDYQLMFGCASQQVNLINEGLYLSHDELPYIDIEKPWWNLEYIKSVSLHEDELYLLFGDMTFNMLQRTCCVFFNIQLLEEKLNMKPQDLYELVYAGEWTIDKFTELVSQVYEDANGNTVSDEDDIHGLKYLGNDPFNWMAFSCGIEYTTRDEDGYPLINMNTETTIDMLDKLCTLFFNNQAVFKTSNADGTNRDFAKLFGEGKSLFCVNRFFIADWEQVRVMTDDYGILPMPKYNEDIEGYHSTVESLVQWCTVPVTVADPVYVSAVAETFAYESRQRTTPAYYETTLKLKNTRDDASIEMIDMIMSGRDTDYIYINSIGGLNGVFKKVYGAGQNNFSSIYASVEAAGEQALAELITQYEDSKN